jgi:hypothetical protein
MSYVSLTVAFTGSKAFAMIKKDISFLNMCMYVIFYS